MNLMDVITCKWNDLLLEACGGPELRSKLGPEPVIGGTILGKVNKYFVDKWGFSPGMFSSLSVIEDESYVFQIVLSCLSLVTTLPRLSHLQLLVTLFCLLAHPRHSFSPSPAQILPLSVSQPLIFFPILPI